MRKSHFNDEFLVLLGPIISRLFICSNAEKRMFALVLSLWIQPIFFLVAKKKEKKSIIYHLLPWGQIEPSPGGYII
jgi:hypothetical protein